MKSNELRNCCQNLEVGSNSKPEKVWKKQLQNILNTDIHKKELGCKCDTHIKIGDVHLNSFYESRILFSHNVWSNRFANWLYEKTKDLNKQKLIVVGYETDVEPVIFLLQNKFADKNAYLRYGIYEERKFTQNNGYAQTKENIRYLESIIELLKDAKPEDVQFVFFCGTSTTLSTFKKMREQLICDFRKNNVDNAILQEVISRSLFYSLIQILPVMGEFKPGIPFQSIYIGSDLSDTANNKIKRSFGEKKTDIIVSEYLIDLQNQWYDAHLCPLCFPLEKDGGDVFEEEPLIATSETSVVPFMMIRDLITENINKQNDLNTNELLWNSTYGYKFVYYDHIDRMDHHFKYYVRTAHLIKAIMDDDYPEKKEIFKSRCNEIKDIINPDYPETRRIDIIVYPSSFGDEVFPLAINEHVFGNLAYLLAVNPNKEFRSNFETKYSNLAYVLEQINNSCCNTEIRFHYVAKQILSIDTFTRIKSFINSMMCKYAKDNKLPNNVVLFSSVIVFLSRISSSSISDYIDPSFYFHFIDVAIPSLRNYGDSCPICKRRSDVNSYIEASNLDICISHWSHKHDLYKPKSIENAIESWRSKDEEIKKRKFRRFDCENRIWKEINSFYCNNEDSYLQAFIQGMCIKNNDAYNVDAESFISSIKAISGPFIYYKEFAKNAALHLLLHSIEAIKRMNPADTANGTVARVEVSKERTFTIVFTSVYQQYTTIIVLLNCLANMDSTYILNPDVIVDLCEFVYRLSKAIRIYRDNNQIESLLVFGKGNCLVIEEELKVKSEEKSDGDSEKKIKKINKVEAFFSCIVYAFKRVICGISGEAKSKYFSKFYYDAEYNRTILEISLLDARFSDLFYVLYLENSTRCNEQIFAREDIIEKYRISLLSYLHEKISSRPSADDIKLILVYRDRSFKNLYPLSGYSENSVDDAHAKSKNEREFHNRFNEYADCFSSDMLKDCGWSRNETNTIFVISLKYYAEGVLETTIDVDDSDDKTMYLVVEFPACKKSSNERPEDRFAEVLRNLETVRTLLEDRYYLCKEIWSDIQNNSIREAIQARESELLMAEGKNIAHNGSRDVREMLKLINDELEGMSRSDNEEQKENHYSNACRMISVMMSYCIGRASNDYLLRSFYSRSSKESVFKNGILHLDYDDPLLAGVDTGTQVNEIDFLSSYFKDLMSLNDDTTSDYFRDCLYKGYDENRNITNKKQVGKISIFINDNDISRLPDPMDEIIKVFKKTNVFPNIFKHNNYTTKTSVGSIFLVGVLDLFVKNVTKHAEGSDIEIRIDNYKDSYYIISVENDINSHDVSSSPGITNWFYESLNQISANTIKGFEINTGPNKENTKYKSEIIVYGGGKNYES